MDNTYGTKITRLHSLSAALLDDMIAQCAYIEANAGSELVKLYIGPEKLDFPVTPPNCYCISLTEREKEQLIETAIVTFLTEWINNDYSTFQSVRDFSCSNQDQRESSSLTFSPLLSQTPTSVYYQKIDVYSSEAARKAFSRADSLLQNNVGQRNTQAKAEHLLKNTPMPMFRKSGKRLYVVPSQESKDIIKHACANSHSDTAGSLETKSPSHPDGTPKASPPHNNGGVRRSPIYRCLQSWLSVSEFQPFYKALNKQADKIASVKVDRFLAPYASGYKLWGKMLSNIANLYNSDPTSYAIQSLAVLQFEYAYRPVFTALLAGLLRGSSSEDIKSTIQQLLPWWARYRNLPEDDPIQELPCSIDSYNLIQQVTTGRDSCDSICLANKQLAYRSLLTGLVCKLNECDRHMLIGKAAKVDPETGELCTIGWPLINRTSLIDELVRLVDKDRLNKFDDANISIGSLRDDLPSIGTALNEVDYQNIASYIHDKHPIVESLGKLLDPLEMDRTFYKTLQTIRSTLTSNTTS